MTRFENSAQLGIHLLLVTVHVEIAGGEAQFANCNPYSRLRWPGLDEPGFGKISRRFIQNKDPQ